MSLKNPDKSESETVSFTLPESLRMELSAVVETGYYDSVSEFLRDAMLSILASRKDLRIAVASYLYKEGKISLGKAVEMVGIDYEEMKKILVDKGIKIRRGAETVEELDEGLRDLKKWREKL